MTQRNTPTPVVGLTAGVTSLGVGYYHTCAVVLGGVRCWGSNGYGQLGDGTTSTRSSPVQVAGLTTGVVQVVSGVYHSCALLETGAVQCWGRNNNGNLGDGSTLNRSTPVVPIGLTSGVQRLSSGIYHTCALLNTGAIRCWGHNTFGSIGDGTTTQRSTPTAVANITTAVEMSAGYYHTCVRLASGPVRCWGYNVAGQIGDGTTSTRSRETQVSGLTGGVSSITAYYYNTCALLSSGALWCWGSNTYGQIGDGTTSLRPVPTRVQGLGGDGC